VCASVLAVPGEELVTYYVPKHQLSPMDFNYLLTRILK